MNADNRLIDLGARIDEHLYINGERLASEIKSGARGARWNVTHSFNELLDDIDAFFYPRLFMGVPADELRKLWNECLDLHYDTT